MSVAPKLYSRRKAYEVRKQIDYCQTSQYCTTTKNRSDKVHKHQPQPQTDHLVMNSPKSLKIPRPRMFANQWHLASSILFSSSLLAQTRLLAACR